ncbi:maleylpyruvate isomerase family mycothiol-dependent enzyme [Streptomyces sp. NPDC056987]|uniref:maleylpyruvate isomerase family mycothiol-dependent enzyme n=1 Tax=Streptomyces sp. NPDC056987 TaxID=3345988 RepID=UPI00363A42CE
MKTSEHIRGLAHEGHALAAAAVGAGPGAEVPVCPGWRVRDVLRHTGSVHRWATAYVTEGGAARVPLPTPPELDGDALVDWFREGHDRLVGALDTAPADLDCWSFLPAPSPLAFWARRQAHETAIHRVDAESALGNGFSPVDAAFAADGIDELLRHFHARDRSRVRSDVPRVLRVRTTDTGDVWTVRITSNPVRTDHTKAPGPGADDDGSDGSSNDMGTGEQATAECELSGPAEKLYLTVWNRLPLDAVTVTGDAALARMWRETSAV